jgi:hypothetical protein
VLGSVSSRVLVLVAALLLGTTACSDGETATDPPSSGGPTTSAGLAQDPELVPLLVALDDLPAGFSVAPDRDDTITSFCANEDAAAGLRALGRALVAYVRDAGGASVIHIVFRFADDGAEAFVAQTEAILQRCSDVPDTSGLAFVYEPLTASVEEALAGAEAHAARYGVAVGSGMFTIDLAAFRQGDLGSLVAVLGADLSREELDALATTAFAAAIARLPG